MYPQRDLTRLAAAKAALRLRIAVRRRRTATAAGRLLRPLSWLDRALETWRQLSPLVRLTAGPLGFLVLRRRSSRGKLLGFAACLLASLARAGLGRVAAAVSEPAGRP